MGGNPTNEQEFENIDLTEEAAEKLPLEDELEEISDNEKSFEKLIDDNQIKQEKYKN